MSGVETRVAIAGLGAIGRVLARRLHDGIPGLALACIAVRDRAKAQAWLDGQGIACPLVELDAMPRARLHLAVECAPAAVFEDICRPMLEAGKAVMVLSAGALLARPHLMDLAGRRAVRSSFRPGRCWGSMRSPRLPRAGSVRSG